MNVRVSLPSCSQFRAKTIDFGRYMGEGIDEIVPVMVDTFRHAIAAKENSLATWNTVITSIRADFLPWLAAMATGLHRQMRLSDIDADLLEAYAVDLRLKNTYPTASAKFTCAMSLIRAMGELGHVPQYSEIRFVGAFPGVQTGTNSAPPYSKQERNALIRAIAGEFRNIRDGTHPEILAGSVDSLAVGLLLLALPTGMNLTPLLELTREALHEHPLRKNGWILVAYKRRGNKPVQAQAKWSDEIAQMRSLDLHLVPVYRQLLEWTKAQANKALKKNKTFLFIRPPLHGRGKGRPVPLVAGDFAQAVRKMNKRYDIRSEADERLRISTRRIRATVAARIYDLSHGDPFVVARVLGNVPKTTSIHYLEPEYGAPGAFLKAVKAFSNRLKQMSTEGHQPTAVAGCSDPLYGRFAPKDGTTYCQRWLHCFQCPNQCITGEEDALWRLYSFYWLLQARRKVLMRLPVAGQVRFVLHVIDTVVTKRFGAKALQARNRARMAPHPMWAEAKAIDALFVGCGNE
ncbi:MAG: hypothetical protein M3Y70_04000 [Pseudomonadota bacterium]|nr:hypothetical protein [Pseudomonadota bacterium]